MHDKVSKLINFLHRTDKEASVTLKRTKNDQKLNSSDVTSVKLFVIIELPNILQCVVGT